MQPPPRSLENGVGPGIAYLLNKHDDDEFAGVLMFANAWTEGDLDAALQNGEDVSTLPAKHLAEQHSGAAVNGDVQKPPSLPTSQIQTARLKAAWQRAHAKKAVIDSRISPGPLNPDLQRQHVILSRWGWQVVPTTPPQQDTLKRNPSTSAIMGNVAASSHVAQKPDDAEIPMRSGNPKTPSERQVTWGTESLTEPLLGGEVEDAQRNSVNLNVDEDDEVGEEGAPKHMLYASYILAALYWITGFIYGMFKAGWSLVDSFYFVTVTVSTVGYGDKTFNQGGAFDKIFGGIYVFVGVVIISVAAGIILNELQLKAEAMVADKMKKSEQDVACGKPPKFDYNKEVANVFLDVGKTFGVIGVALAIGSAGMMWLEEWDFADSFYFCSITMTTVGYGDLVPSNDKSKVFVTIYVLFAFGVLASSMSAVGAVPFRLQELKKIEKCLSLLGDSLEAEELEALCECEEIRSVRNAVQIEEAKEDPHVLRSEFVLWQLLKQGKLKMDDIAPCLATFDSLDTDHSGNLNQEDIDLFLANQAASADK